MTTFAEFADAQARLDRSVIAKARFQDYDRSLRRKGGVR